jgi:sodium/potassium-transporting ATPase subunit alpha
MSTHVMKNGSQFIKDEEWEKKFKEANITFGEGGQRVLGLAKLHLPIDKFPEDFQFNCKNPADSNFPMKGFAFVGLISLIDPPRENVPFSILKCKAAGVKVIMVTGDQPVTATAIGRQVNILSKTEKTVNQIMEDEKISFDEAFEKSESLVIHGDLIMHAIKEDELLPEGKLIKFIIILKLSVGRISRNG